MPRTLMDGRFINVKLYGRCYYAWEIHYLSAFVTTVGMAHFWTTYANLPNVAHF
jgi:hypothetical protein